MVPYMGYRAILCNAFTPFKDNGENFYICINRHYKKGEMAK